jgi:hypothetical protein
MSAWHEYEVRHHLFGQDAVLEAVLESVPKAKPRGRYHHHWHNLETVAITLFSQEAVLEAMKPRGPAVPKAMPKAVPDIAKLCRCRRGMNMRSAITLFGREAVLEGVPKDVLEAVPNTRSSRWRSVHCDARTPLSDAMKWSLKKCVHFSLICFDFERLFFASAIWLQKNCLFTFLNWSFCGFLNISAGIFN